MISRTGLTIDDAKLPLLDGRKKRRVNHPIYTGRDFTLYRIGGHYYYFFPKNNQGRKQYLCMAMWKALYRIRRQMRSQDPIFVEFQLADEKSNDGRNRYDLLLHEISFESEGENHKNVYEGKTDVCFMRAKQFIRQWEKDEENKMRLNQEKTK